MCLALETEVVAVVAAQWMLLQLLAVAAVVSSVVVVPATMVEAASVACWESGSYSYLGGSSSRGGSNSSRSSHVGVLQSWRCGGGTINNCSKIASTTTKLTAQM